MDDEERNIGMILRSNGNNNSNSNSSYGTSGDETTIESSSLAAPPPSLTGVERLRAQEAQEAKERANESHRWIPGEANPALAETIGFADGSVSTADLLRARGRGEALLPNAMEDRDKGLAGRPPFHGSPALHIGGLNSEDDIYDIEERHVMHEEPGMHVFAPQMLNIPSE